MEQSKLPLNDLTQELVNRHNPNTQQPDALVLPLGGQPSRPGEGDQDQYPRINTGVEGQSPTLKVTSPNKNGSGTFTLQYLQDDWYKNVPLEHGIKTEEERTKWFKEHTFVQYLAALIILDILVLNDRALQKMEESLTTKGGSEADDSGEEDDLPL